MKRRLVLILGLLVLGIGLPTGLLSPDPPGQERDAGSEQREQGDDHSVMLHSSSSGVEVARPKHSRRPDEISLLDAFEAGATIEADVKGRRQAEGNVKVTTADGVKMLADRVRISSDGSVVAKGNVTLSKDGENGFAIMKSESMTWHFTPDRKLHRIDANGEGPSADKQ